MGIPTATPHSTLAPRVRDACVRTVANWPELLKTATGQRAAVAKLAAPVGTALAELADRARVLSWLADRPLQPRAAALHALLVAARDDRWDAVPALLDALNKLLPTVTPTR